MMFEFIEVVTVKAPIDLVDQFDRGL